MGHSGDRCVYVSILCKYDLRKEHVFVLCWARVRQVMLMCDGGVRSILLLPLVARC